MHLIREERLKRLVLRRRFDVIAMFFEDIMSFQKAVYEQRFEEAEKVRADREMVCAYEQDKVDFDSFAAVIRKYVGDYQTDAHDCQRVCEEDYRPCAGQVQWPPAAENPDYLELHRGTETGRGRTNH